MAEDLTPLQACTELLKEIHEYKVEDLERSELGKFHFSEVLESERKLINLFKRISIKVLEDIPDDQLITIIERCKNLLKHFNEILEFDEYKDNSLSEHTSIISRIDSLYPSYFKSLHQWIAYSASVTTDFSRLRTEADDVINTVKTDSSELLDKVEVVLGKVKKIHKDIKEVAGEMGVTEEAKFFHNESVYHKKEAKKWRGRIVIFACILGLFSLISLSMHNWGWLSVDSAYETIQLAVSKIMVFGVLSYLLYISARNYLAHQHNLIVNKHRRNSLMTYKTLVDAASGDPQNIVLLHAAACIYSPQPTGYSKDAEVGAPNTKSLFQLATDVFTGSDG